VGDEEADVVVNRDGACGLVGGSLKCVSSSLALPASTITEFGNDVVALDAEGEAFCARKANGTALCSILDHAITFGSSNGGPTVTEVRTGTKHACALLSDQSLWCAGDNDRGQLGLPSTVGWSDAPQRIPALGNVLQFDLGDNVTCARDASGWRCAGDNFNNTFGTSPWVIREPTLVAPWVVN
jgi:hypothetical protein